MLAGCKPPSQPAGRRARQVSSLAWLPLPFPPDHRVFPNALAIGSMPNQYIAGMDEKLLYTSVRRTHLIFANDQMESAFNGLLGTNQNDALVFNQQSGSTQRDSKHSNPPPACSLQATGWHPGQPGCDIRSLAR